MVQFTANGKELRRAISEIEVNRGLHSKTDLVDLVVSGSAAFFRSVGTETEISVNGTHPGTARVPLRILSGLAKVVCSTTPQTVTVSCESGLLRTGTFSFRHPDIKLELVPDQRIGIPIDVSLLDTLALRKLLTVQEAGEQGLRGRFQEAEAACAEAIRVAVGALKEFGVDEKQIARAIDDRVAEAASKLRVGVEA